MMKNFFRKVLKVLGPGMITGVADDDPSGIATYSQTGAQFGYGMLWTVLFMLPLQTAIQEACARIGAVNGEGIAAVIKKHYGKKILYVIVSLLLIANTINIGADIGAMAEAIALLIPINFIVATIFFTLLTLILEIFIPYKKYVNFLKWLCLSLLAYPLTLFIVKQSWLTVLKSTLIPHIEWDSQFLFIITGVLGTTISPYLFFWQASEEVEEERCKHLIKDKGTPKISKNFMRNLRIDNFAGMLFSQIGTWSIIVVGAAVLNAHGVKDITSAADAAKALEPLVQTFPNAGFVAKLIFATGIIGLGLISVPILAGSVAYALSETFNWPEGLNLKFKRAHGFYGVIIVATLIGLCFNFFSINPMKSLVYAAVINGVIAVPLILMIGFIAKNKKIMGEYTSGKLSSITVWITFFTMLIAAVSMFFA